MSGSSTRGRRAGLRRGAAVGAGDRARGLAAYGDDEAKDDGTAASAPPVAPAPAGPGKLGITTSDDGTQGFRTEATESGKGGLVNCTQSADGRVAVEVHQVARSLDDEVLADQQVTHLFTFGDGQIVRFDIAEGGPTTRARD